MELTAERPFQSERHSQGRDMSGIIEEEKQKKKPSQDQICVLSRTCNLHNQQTTFSPPAPVLSVSLTREKQLLPVFQFHTKTVHTARGETQKATGRWNYDFSPLSTVKIQEGAECSREVTLRDPELLLSLREKNFCSVWLLPSSPWNPQNTSSL